MKLEFSLHKTSIRIWAQREGTWLNLQVVTLVNNLTTNWIFGTTPMTCRGCPLLWLLWFWSCSFSLCLFFEWWRWGPGFGGGRGAAVPSTQITSVSRTCRRPRPPRSGRVPLSRSILLLLFCFTKFSFTRNNSISGSSGSAFDRNMFLVVNEASLRFGDWFFVVLLGFTEFFLPVVQPVLEHPVLVCVYRLPSNQLKLTFLFTTATIFYWNMTYFLVSRGFWSVNACINAQS